MSKRIAFIIIILLLSTKATVAGSIHDQLVELAEFASSELAAVDEWEVTLKETRTENELMQRLQDVQRNGHKVTVVDSKKAIYYKWQVMNKKTDIHTDYKMLIPKNDAYDSELIVVISGSSWNDTIRKSYKNVKHNITTQYFTENVLMFTCLTTYERDIMNDRYVKQLLKDQLDLTYIEFQKDFVKDTHKTIIYGYTHLWATKIDMKDKPINFQMVLRQGPSDGIQYVLGTPILINEY